MFREGLHRIMYRWSHRSSCIRVIPLLVRPYGTHVAVTLVYMCRMPYTPTVS